MRARTDAKRDAILAAAAQAFRELGYKRASMAHIAARFGGSKATLYGYFASKELLFVEVARMGGEKHMHAALQALHLAPQDLAPALTRFGEKYLAFITLPETLATQRMLIAESGLSDIGCRFYEAGPKRGIACMAQFLQAEMARGRLRSAEPEIVAKHFMGLVQAEVFHGLLLGLPTPRSRAHLHAIAERAVSVFLAAYAPPAG